MADKSKIAAHYLASSPPGQLADVERDVVTVAGPAALTPEALTAAHRAYNLKTYGCIRVGDGVILAVPEGEVEPGVSLDSHSQAIVRVDHDAATGEVVPADAAASIDLSPHFGTPQEPLRAATATAVARYVGAAYNSAAAGTWPWAKGCEVFVAPGGGLVIYTSVVLRNLTNFWSGAWRGRYTVAPAASAGASGGYTLAGSIAIVTHYFESGNTQMHADRAVGPKEIPAGATHEATAAAIAAAIAAAEDGLHASLDDMYESLSSQALKEMRRFLPVSGVKMNWAQATGAARLAKSLASGGSGGGASAAAAAAPAAGSGTA